MSTVHPGGDKRKGFLEFCQISVRFHEPLKTENDSQNDKPDRTVGNPHQLRSENGRPTVGLQHCFC